MDTTPSIKSGEKKKRTGPRVERLNGVHAQIVHQARYHHGQGEGGVGDFCSDAGHAFVRSHFEELLPDTC